MRGKRNRPTDDVWDGHGGYMGMKKAKLVEQFKEQAKGEEKNKGIFSGVSIFVNGWTKPSSDELKRIMMSHGGVYHHYYNSHKTTHIIASNLPDVKLRQLKGHELIVKPEWITACLNAERLIDYKPFLLFTHQSKHQGTINFKPVQQNLKLEEESFAVTNEDECAPEIPNEPQRASGEQKDVHESDTRQTETSPFKAKDATDPRFMGEFFQNSRLHHISTMGSNAKEYMNNMREKHDGTFSGRESLTHLMNTDETPRKTIMHIDMDCFFVSVGLRNRPDLVGKPVAVAHSRGNKASRGAEEDRLATERRKSELLRYKEKLDKRSGVSPDTDKSLGWKLDNIDGLSSFSELASCSYEAREMGVRNGMFLGPALKLCPNLETIPYDFAGYEEVSRILYDTVSSYTLDIQAVSCDEMFVNLTPLLTDLRLDALKFVTHLRDEIKTKTKCKCSVGLSHNIFLARMATKKAKPDGQYLLEESGIMEVLQELKVSDLPGVGRSLQRKLSTLNIETCGDLQKLILRQLQAEVGNKTGSQLYNFCRGIDNRKLELEQVRKTVSAEVNYGIRFNGWEDAKQFLLQLSGEVADRLERLGTKGKCITLKLMVRAENAPAETAKFLGHGVCDNMSRSSQLSIPTSDKEKIFKEIFSLIKQIDAPPADIRGIGISVSKLEERRVNSNNSIMKFVKIQGPKATDLPANITASKPETNSAPLIEEDLNVQGNQQLAQLDPEVLAALPEDIRKEVLSEYRRNNGTTVPPNVPDEDRPGPSHRVDYPPDNSLTPGISLSDLSFSQIDGDVLKELPPELRAEITSHFRPKSQEKHAEVHNPVPIAPVFSSPVKKVPVLKKKRGRPKKNSSAMNATTSKPASVSTVSLPPVVEEDESRSNDFDIHSDPDDDTQDESETAKTPTFCGMSSLEELRPLIKEWLRSTVHPMDEDLGMMSTFLRGLITNKKIHIVSIILKSFYRNICKLDDPGGWIQSYSNLVNMVQHKMVESYGKPLYIAEKFD